MYPNALIPMLAISLNSPLVIVRRPMLQYVVPSPSLTWSQRGFQRLFILHSFIKQVSSLALPVCASSLLLLRTLTFLHYIPETCHSKTYSSIYPSFHAFTHRCNEHLPLPTPVSILIPPPIQKRSQHAFQPFVPPAQKHDVFCSNCLAFRMSKVWILDFCYVFLRDVREWVGGFEWISWGGLRGVVWCKGGWKILLCKTFQIHCYVFYRFYHWHQHQHDSTFRIDDDTNQH